MAAMSSKDLVSIIIPTYMSEATLYQCLDSIAQQAYNKIEVIVVDGGSTDRTLEIAKHFGVLCDVNAGMGMSEATNHGFSLSGGAYIYRVDSDVILEDSVVEQCVAACENDQCDAVSIFWGPDPSISFWAKVRKLEKECYRDNVRIVGARFMRRSVFAKIGGYNSSLTLGEDYDLIYKILALNCTIGTIESKEVHIGEPKSISQIIKKQYKYGKTVDTFFKSHPRTGAFHMSPFRRDLTNNWKIFLRHPILGLGFLFYEYFVYCSTFLGFLVNRLQNVYSRSRI